MSDAEQGAREWRFYIKDMIEFGEKVLAYIIWTIIQDAIPKLLPELRNLLNTMNEDSV